MNQVGNTATELAEEIKSGVAIAGETISLSDAKEVVRSLVEKYQSDTEAMTLQVAGEIQGLLGFIETAKSDIASMRPATLVKRDLPTAADELDAIVAHTEQAAGEIMDAADELSDIAQNCDGAVADKLEAVATKIFEASTFQDITGQRITKVVKVIKYIEDKLDLLAESVGDLAGEDGVVVTKSAEVNNAAVGEDALLNGPQLEGEGNSQDDIDALLASFD